MGKISEVSGGGTGFPSDSITLKRLDTGAAETAQVDVEYYSPEQHGGIYGTIVRTYFGTSLPAYLSSGTSVAEIISFNVQSNDSGNRLPNSGNDYISGIVRATLIQAGPSGNSYLILKEDTWTCNRGWVDYVKS